MSPRIKPLEQLAPAAGVLVTVRTRPAGIQERAAQLARFGMRLLPWSPLVAAFAYAVALLVNLGSIVSAIYRSADWASALTIGQAAAAAPRTATVTLGHIPWYTALWFEEITRGVPDHRILWEVTPWLATLLGVGLLAWAVACVADRWAAAMVAVLCACSGAALLPTQFGWSVHSMSYVHICLLGASIVPLSSTSGWIGGRRWTHVALLLLLAVVSGLGAASDELVIAGGLVPFILVGVAVVATRPGGERRIRGLSYLAVVLGTACVSELAQAIGRSQHIQRGMFPMGLAHVQQLWNHVGDLIGSLLLLLNGDFIGVAPGLVSVVAFLAAVSLLIGLGWVLRAGWRIVTQLPHANLAATRMVIGVDLGRAALLGYWATSAIVVSLVFVCTTIPRGIQTGRYVVTVAYALVVIVCVTAAAAPGVWRRMAVALGATLVAGGAALALGGGQVQVQAKVHPLTNIGQLVAVARSYHVRLGYAGYWDAAPLTWESRGRLSIYPVAVCSTTLCSFPFHQISSWYAARADVRSFVITDPTLDPTNFTDALSALGRPLSVIRLSIGDMYIYAYDIASRFHDATSDRSSSARGAQLMVL